MFLLRTMLLAREATNKRSTTSERLDSFGEMIHWSCSQTSSKDIRHHRVNTSPPTGMRNDG